LAQIQQNSRYEVTFLELSVYRFDTGSQGLQFTPTLEVMDLTENQKHIADVAQQDLREQRDTLNIHIQEKIAIKNLLLSNLQAIREYSRDWKVKKYGKNACSISGQGLGWSDEKLTSGTWDFRTDTGQMTPMDTEGLALFSFITSR
jgi:hypothetical protein